MPVDRFGKELKVGQTVVYSEAISQIGVETIKSIGKKQVTLVEKKWGGFTRRDFNQVVVVEVTQ